MNRVRAKELLPIIEAFVDGEDVQYQERGGWVDLLDPTFLEVSGKYRIKPKLREFWINPDANDSDAIIYEAFNPKNDDFIHVREVQT